MSRYAGKPLLRILECYALDAIGHLTQHETETLQRMEPKLRSLFGRTGTWKEIVEAEMNMSAASPSEILAVWEKNRLKAKENGEDLPPEHFAQIFVDGNFQV